MAGIVRRVVERDGVEAVNIDGIVHSVTRGTIIAQRDQLHRLLVAMTPDQPYNVDSEHGTTECMYCDEDRHFDSYSRPEKTWFGHKPDCPWLEAMAVLGRDLGQHRVYDPREDCMRCEIYDSTLEEHWAHVAHTDSVRHLDTRFGGIPFWELLSYRTVIVPYARREDPIKAMMKFALPRGQIKFYPAPSLTDIRAEGQ